MAGVDAKYGKGVQEEENKNYSQKTKKRGKGEEKEGVTFGGGTINLPY